MYLLHTVMFLAIFHRKAWYFTEKLGTSILQRKLIWYLFWVLCRESINCIISLRKSGVFFLQREPEVSYRKHLVFLHWKHYIITACTWVGLWQCINLRQRGGGGGLDRILLDLLCAAREGAYQIMEVLT